MRANAGRGQRQGGFILITAALIVAGLLTLTQVGLTRTMVNVSAANLFVARQQAFEAAEGGIDEALVNPAVYNKAGTTLSGQIFTPAEINQLLRGSNDVCDQGQGDDGRLTVAPDSHYELTLLDNQDANPDPCVDTDQLLFVSSTGHGGSAKRTLRVLIQLPVASVPQAFKYALAASRLSLSGNAEIGNGAADGSGRVTLYVGLGTGGATHDAIKSAQSSNVWASQVDFVNPLTQTLEVLCSRCDETGVFHSLPDGSRPLFTPAPGSDTSGVPPLPDISVDPMAYYNKAIEQCVAENSTELNRDQKCRDGTAMNGSEPSRHHITDTSSTTNVSGTFEGIMYVEAGADVVINNATLIKGTVFHEGTTANDNVGSFKLGANNDLRIDSFAKTDINSDGILEDPFAPGVAIVGRPNIDWPNQGTLNWGSSLDPGVKGFVMSGHHSGFVSSGAVQGGILGVTPVTSEEPEGVMGPSVPGPWVYSVNLGEDITIGGSAKIEFKALTESPCGFNGSSCGGGSGGVSRPTIRYWSME